MDIEKYIKLTNKEYEKNGKSELFIKAQNAIINKNDPSWIYMFAKDVKDADIDGLQSAIIARGNAGYMYQFAKDVKGADIVKLEDAIVETSSGLHIYLFAKDVKGADISKLEDAIIVVGNAETIYDFAKNVKGVDVKKLEDAIMSKQGLLYIYKFAKDIKGADVERLQNKIIQTKNAEYIIAFARDVKGADIVKIEDAIIATGNRKCICEFAKQTNRCTQKIFTALFDLDDIGPLTDYLISFKITNDNIHIKALDLMVDQEKYRLWMQALASGNRKWVYKIDDNFQISKEGTIELLVKLKKADAIYHYAKFYIVDEEEYRKQLQQALIDSGDVHYIAEFVNNIPWADKARLQKALKDTKAKRKTLKLEDLVEDVENGVLQ